MLLPTQQTYGIAATNVMQAMLDSIEEQRKKEEAERSGKERDLVSEARISASEEARRAEDKIASALFGVNRTDPSALKIELIDRLAGKLGIDTDEARSSFKLGKALEDALKDMLPDEAAKLAEDIGLDEIGISMETLLSAIKNPYGDDNQRLMDALTKKANGGRLDTEVERVVQRLEDVADPKTLEELKLGPQGYDPTRIEDEETRAERQEDVEAAEAGKKLEDVRKVQQVIEKTNDQAVGAPDAEGTTETAPTDDAAALLAVFAVAAEQAARTDKGDASVAALSDATSAERDGATSGRVRTEDEIPTSALHENLVKELVAGEAAGQTEAGILPVRVDDIGIYELLKRKLAA